MCTQNELHIILDWMLKEYYSVHGEWEQLQEGLKIIWDKSSDLELKYGTIVSPAVIPFDEYERYKEDMPYYRNIENEGVEIVVCP